MTAENFGYHRRMSVADSSAHGRRSAGAPTMVTRGPSVFGAAVTATGRLAAEILPSLSAIETW